MVVPDLQHPLACLMKKGLLAIYLLLLPLVGGSYCYYSSTNGRYYCDYGYDANSAGSVVAAVVGGIVGMIFFITCIAIIVCTLNQKKKKKKKQNQSQRNQVLSFGADSSNAFHIHGNPTYGVPMHELNGGFQHMNGPNPSAPNLVQYGVQPSAPPLPPSSPPPAFQYIPPPPSSQEIQESTSS